MREDDAPCRVAQPTAGCSYHFLFQISITQEFRAPSTPISPRHARQHHPPTSCIKVKFEYGKQDSILIFPPSRFITNSKLSQL